MLQGTFWKPKSGEDYLDIISEMTNQKWGIKIKRDEIGQWHKLGSGYIFEFLYRAKGTTFHRLLQANPEHSNADRRKINITVRIKLSPYDLKIQEMAKKLVHEGIIDDFYTDSVSGKIILLQNNIKSTISVVSDIEKFATRSY